MEINTYPEIKPEQVRQYLKLITEAIVQINNNKGVLRRDIWQYLYSKYYNQGQLEYRDFLLAMR